MIVALVDTLADRLALEDRLRTNRAEVNAIQATLQALNPVADEVRELVEKLNLCAPFLNEQTLADIRAQISDAVRDLESSRTRFATTNRKEWLSLKRPREGLQRSAKDLAEGWQSYAKSRLAPYLDLIRLVNYLPDVATSADELNQIVEQLENQVLRPPRSQGQFDQFHNRLVELGRRLDAVARLPPNIRVFLTKVIDSKATLADLTPEVWGWLSEGDRAKAFLITFAPRRS